MYGHPIWRHNMNIAVIFTGGTIGSSVSQNFIDTDSAMPYRLLAMYKKSQEKTGTSIPHFIPKQPYTTLSEYLNGSHLNTLSDCIDSLLKTDIDGIIVTHGTDTLPYTAAALGLFYAHAKIPIILVSSNYVLDDPRANGLVNFTHAVEYMKACSTCKQDSLPVSVGISYCNQNSTPNILNALGVYDHYPYDDSLYERPYNAYSDAIAPVLQELSQNRHPYSTLSPVQSVKCMPGQHYALFQDARAILIHPYHSGTCNTNDASFLAFIKEAEKRKIPVYLTGISKSETAYDSTKCYQNLGMHILPEYSPIVAYMLLWYRYSVSMP